MAMRVAVFPEPVPAILQAVERAGAAPSAPDVADGLVWTAVGEPESLRGVLRPTHRWIGLLTAGVDAWAGVLDEERVWTCARGVYSQAVAEHAVALILSISRRLFAAAQQERWTPLPGRRLKEMTIAVVGTGTVGRALAGLLAPFGPRVLGVNRSGSPAPGFAQCVPATELRAAAAQAHVVVLTVPLTPATRGLVDRALLAELHSDVWIVNVARGEVVDTDALVDALRERTIGGAALDVTDPEPLPPGHALWGMPNVVVTGHMANPNRGRPWDFHQDEVAAHVAHNLRALAGRERFTGVIDARHGF
jgi:D-3-phosphoglycerate dehydrogenase